MYMGTRGARPSGWLAYVPGYLVGEQYVANRRLASFIDDVVVFLFVVDVSLVIWGNLKNGQRSGVEGKAEVSRRSSEPTRTEGSEVEEERLS